MEWDAARGPTFRRVSTARRSLGGRGADFRAHLHRREFRSIIANAGG